MGGGVAGCHPPPPPPPPMTGPAKEVLSFRDCPIFYQHFDDLHRLLRSFIVQVMIPLLNTLLEDSTKLFQLSQLELESDSEISDSLSDIGDL